MHLQILYWFSPKWAIANGRRFMGLLSIYCVSKTFNFIILSSLSPFFKIPFLNVNLNLSPTSHLSYIFVSPLSRFFKTYYQSKTFLNIWAVPSSAVFSNNAVLITFPVLLYNSSVSLRCYQVPQLSLEWLYYS